MDFSDLGGKKIDQGLDFSDLGGQKIEQPQAQQQPSLLNRASDAITSVGQKIAPALDMASKVAEGVNALTNPMQALATYNSRGVMSAAGDLANRAGEYVAEKGGELGYPKTAAVAGMVAANAPFLALPGEGKLDLAIKGDSAIPTMLENRANVAGRRALGYTKAYLNEPGATEKANQVARTMIDQGVIQNPVAHPFSSGTEGMVDRATQLNKKSGKAIGQTIDTLKKTGTPAFNTSDVVNQIESQLKPARTGGAYDALHNIVNEITDTVKAHGEGPIDFQSAQELKKTLQDIGYNSADSSKAKLYQRASGIVKQALEQGVEKGAVDPGMLANYVENKKLSGATAQASDALTNRLSSEGGNKRIGLTDTIAAGEMLAHEGGLKAALLLALKKAAERRGNALEATVANSTAKGLRNAPNIVGNPASSSSLFNAYVQSKRKK